MREVVVYGMAARDTAMDSTMQVNGDELIRSDAAGREESTLVVVANVRPPCTSQPTAPAGR